MHKDNLEILKEEGYFGHVISKKLPKGLDNRLYTMVNLIGGMTIKDVSFFANQATPIEIKMLHKKVKEFPSRVNEILPYAGAYKMLLESPQYQEIVDMVKFGFREEEMIEEQIDTERTVDIDTYDIISGYPVTNNIFLNKYIRPELKEKLFKYWDSEGEPDYEALKLFGVYEDLDEDFGDFRNVGDVVYPLLVIEWVGGVENTKFAKAPWQEFSEMGFEKLKFKVEPIGFDYMFDESESYGEHGYACWDIRILIDKDGDLYLPVSPEFIDNDYTPFIQDLFPESARNKLSSHHNYTEDQFELMEELWMQYDEYRELSSQFCRVEVVLVDDTYDKMP